MEKPGKSINTPDALPEDEKDFTSLIRPKDFKEFGGDRKSKEDLKSLYTKLEEAEKESLDHVYYGSPRDSEKLTLAHIIANELAADIITTSDRL